MTDASLPRGGPLPVPWWYAALTLLVFAAALAYVGAEAANAPPSNGLAYRPVIGPTHAGLQAVIAVLGIGGGLLAIWRVRRATDE